MTKKEISSNNWLENIYEYLDRKYGQPDITDKFGREWYRVEDGYHIHPALISSAEGIVIEHVKAPMTVYAAEDGDVFHFEDYATVDEMIKDIENEVSGGAD